MRLLGALQRHSRADIVSCNSTLSSCGWAVAYLLFADCPTHGLRPSLVTRNALAAVAPWAVALELFWEAMATRCHDVVTLNAAVTSCARGARWLEALELLQVGVPDVVSLTAAITGCQEVALWQGGLRLLGDCAVRGLRPDAIALHASLSTCEKAAQWEHALSAARLLTAAGTSYDALASACERAAQWPQSLSLVSRAGAWGVRRLVAHAAAGSACGKAARWRQALQLFAGAARACAPTWPGPTAL